MNWRPEVYTTFVSTISAAESRRQRASTVYLGMVAAIATIGSGLTDVPTVVPAASILIIAVTWGATIRSFRRLAKAKFAVVKELEKDFHLPPFQREDVYFKASRSLFNWRLGTFEMVPPILSMLISGGYLAYRLFRWLLEAP